VPGLIASGVTRGRQPGTRTYPTNFTHHRLRTDRSRTLRSHVMSSKIQAGAVALALTTLLVTAEPASAQNLRWSRGDVPADAVAAYTMGYAPGTTMRRLLPVIDIPASCSRARGYTNSPDKLSGCSRRRVWCRSLSGVAASGETLGHEVTQGLGHEGHQAVRKPVWFASPNSECRPLPSRTSALVFVL
jgi:hypothetical protein